VCDFEGGSQPPKDNFIYEPNENYVRFIQIRDFGERGKETYIPISKRNKLCIETDILIGRYGASVGKICKGLNGAYNVALIKCINNKEKLLNDYLYHLLKSNTIQNKIIELSDRAAQAGVNPEHLKDTLIPLPPLEIQEEIVRELEQYQKIIDGAKQVVDNYKPIIDIDPSWEIKELGDVYLENLDSKRKPVTKSVRTNGEYPYYGASGIVDYVEEYIFNEPLLLISEDGANLITRNTPIAFSVDGKIWVNNHAHILKFNTSITQKYIENYINQIDISKFVTGSAQPKLNQQNLNLIPIPVPSLEIQQSIVERIESERKIIEGNKKLIEIFTHKIQDRINKIWGD
jgi:restriction endonuclease S subunit